MLPNFIIWYIVKRVKKTLFNYKIDIWKGI